MSKKKPTPGSRPKKKTEVSLVRSSAAEYLTVVAAGGDSQTSVEMRYEDENVWLTQKMMAALYDVSVPAINQHLKRIFSDNELEESSVVKQYLIAAADGKNYQTKHYSLQAIIAVGFKIENERAVQFRKWANQIVKDYTIQGWTMDAERLKHGSTLTDEFFERQLEKIREIRLSERKFYQKITDIYATSIDYNVTVLRACTSPSSKSTMQIMSEAKDTIAGRCKVGTTNFEHRSSRARNSTFQIRHSPSPPTNPARGPLPPSTFALKPFPPASSSSRNTETPMTNAASARRCKQTLFIDARKLGKRPTQVDHHEYQHRLAA